MPPTPDATLTAIHAAFDKVVRGQITLHEAEVIDNYGTLEDRADARRHDTETHWAHVSGSDLSRCPSALSHLDPASWRYYLPAYMVWSIRHFRETASMLPDATIYALWPSDDPTLGAYLIERFHTLDEPQTSAVAQFLRFMAVNDGQVDGQAATDALAAYWSRATQTRTDPSESAQARDV